jgi:hypothetical protein
MERTNRLTLLEACGRAGLKPPVSHADLVHVLHTLRDRGVRHNLMDEPIMRLADEPCWCQSPAQV